LTSRGHEGRGLRSARSGYRSDAGGRVRRLARACRTVGRVNMSSVTDARANLMSIKWQDQSEDFRQWLVAFADIELRRLAPGQEADTWVLAREGRPEHVLKVWNRGFKADAKEQHRYLSHARQAGLPVPRSVGWGRDEADASLSPAREYGLPAIDVGEAILPGKHVHRQDTSRFLQHVGVCSEVGHRPSGVLRRLALLDGRPLAEECVGATRIAQ